MLTVLLMVTTGTLNTVSAGLQLARQAWNSVGEYAYFEHYYVQTLFMMLGESMCMVVYWIFRYGVYRNEPKKIDGDMIPMNPLVLWPASFLDITATSLGYMGLGFMKNPGFFQMLRVSAMIFCGLISIPVLKQKLKIHNWMGILIVCAGLLIKAIPNVLTHDQAPSLVPDPDDKAASNFCSGNMTEVSGVYWTLDPSFGSTPAPEVKTEMEIWVEDNGMIIGIFLVLVGEFFHGAQFVYEEKYLKKYNLPPLMCVGLEGINGVLTLLVLLWPAYFIVLGKPFGLGPEHRFEDAIDAFSQIFDGRNGGWLLAWTFGNMCSIAVFNFAGITVMKELSATSRAVLDNIRIVVIWAIFLIPLGPYLCRLQDGFNYVAPIGLVILLCGVSIYLDVLIMPTIRKLTGKGQPAETEIKEEA